ncbi:MAG: enoyl-CoA hydratase/isomerase family protein [bacterium]
MEEFIKQEIDQGILTLKINRPPHNFIKLPVIQQLGSIIEHINNTHQYNGLILTSAIDDTFTSGHEIVDLSQEESDKRLKRNIRFIAEVLLSIQRLPIPTLTIINGHCVGFGLELSLCTDFRFVYDNDINIGFPDVKIGTFPPFGGIYRLVKLIGEIRARELLLKGKLIKPATAMEWGLVDAIVSKDQAMAEAKKLFKGISKYAPLAITAIKRAIVDATLKDFMTVIRDDIDDYLTVVRSYDYSEGRNALEQGRNPEFNRK